MSDISFASMLPLRICSQFIYSWSNLGSLIRIWIKDSKPIVETFGFFTPEKFQQIVSFGKVMVSVFFFYFFSEFRRPYHGRLPGKGKNYELTDYVLELRPQKEVINLIYRGKLKASLTFPFTLFSLELLKQSAVALNWNPIDHTHKT